MKYIKYCPICSSESFECHIKSKDFSVSKEDFSIVKCSKCNFKFTNPRPSDKELGKYYISDHYISHNNSRNNLFEKAYQIVRKISIRMKYSLVSEFFNRGRVLDIGCGTGDFLQKCNEKKWKTKGIEPSEIARVQAIKNYNLDVDEDTDLKKIIAYSRIITLWHVLENVTELNMTVSDIKRLLSKDGKALIAVPNLESFDSSYYKKYCGYDLPIHLYHFSKDSIIKLFENHGFSLIKTKGMKFDSYYVSMLSEEHKTGNKNYFKSLIIGTISNLFGIFTKRGFSSTIYVFEKKK